MKIEIKQLSEKEVNEIGIKDWPVWTKEISSFDCYYDSKELCLILEGQIKVHYENEIVNINPGDFVTFPKGLKCKWENLVSCHIYYDVK